MTEAKKSEPNNANPSGMKAKKIRKKNEREANPCNVPSPPGMKSEKKLNMSETEREAKRTLRMCQARWG